MRLDKDVRKTLTALGYGITSANSNLKWRDAQGRTLITAQSPSDHRSTMKIMSTVAKQQGCTIHGLQEVIDKRAEEHRQRRLQASAEPVLPVEPVVLLPVTLPKVAPLYSAEDECLLAKWSAQENRNLRKKEAKEAEEKRQRGLLLPFFTKVLEMGHDLLWNDIEVAGGITEKYEHFAINAAADMNAGLRMRGFAASRLLLADYSVAGDVRGFTFVIEVCDYFLDPFYGTITGTPRWIVQDDVVCECYQEMRLTHNKDFTRYRACADWFCDRCRAKGKPEHRVGDNTLLCKKCFKDDPSENGVVSEFKDRYANAEERAAHCGAS
jgi:hypothetical protein